MTQWIIPLALLVFIWLGAVSIVNRESNSVRNYSRLLFYAIILTEVQPIAKSNAEEDLLRTTPRPRREEPWESSLEGDDNAMALEELRSKLSATAQEIKVIGQNLYERHKGDLEKQHWGQFVVFDITTGGYVVAGTWGDAQDLSKEQLSSSRTWCCRIGEPMNVRGLT